MADRPNYRTEHRLQLIGGDPKEFLVFSFEYEEELNESYSLNVRCKIPAAQQEGVAQACSSRRGKDAEFFLQRQFPDGELLETRFSGIIETIERAQSVDPEKGDMVEEFIVKIKPAFELLKNESTGGTWHNTSYADILFEMLDKGLPKFGRTYERKLTGEYPEVDFTVRRPDESMFDFCQKLMRRMGVNYFFDHSAGVEVMVLCDNNDGFPEGIRRGSRPLTKQWSNDNPTDDEEMFSQLAKSAGTPPAGKIFKNFDIKTPQLPIEGLADFGAILGALAGLIGGGGLGGFGGFGGGGGGGGTNTDGSVVEHERIRTNELDAQGHLERRAKLEEQVITNKVSDLQGNSTFTGAQAGRTFEIEIDPGDVRKVVFSKISAKGERYAVPPKDYTNEITLIPTVDEGGQAVDIRPIKEVDESNHFGMHRAEVIAIENDPVDVDDMLRCRLKFPWDDKEEPKLTYVSVLQPMGGTHSGSQWFPRAGDRVLVVFVGGQHETPVIVGCLYDKELPPPEMGPDRIVLPESRSWIGWSHASIGDKARQTMMNLKLDAGDELVFWNAPWDWLEKIGRDYTTEIERDNIRTIGRDFKEDVGGDYTQTVKGDRTETVEGGYTLNVKGHTNLNMSGNQKNTVSGAVKNSFQNGLKESIMGSASETTTGSRSFTSMGSYSITSTTNIRLTAPTITLAGAVVGFGGMGAAVSSELSLKPTSILKSPVSATVRGGLSELKADSKGMRLKGPSTHITDQMGGSTKLSNGKLVVDAPQGVEFRCGLNSLKLSPDGLYLNGAKLNIDAGRTELRTTAFDIIGPEPDGDGIE